MAALRQPPSTPTDCVEILRGVQEQSEQDHAEGCARRLLANLDVGDEPPEEANDMKENEWEFEGD